MIMPVQNTSQQSPNCPAILKKLPFIGGFNCSIYESFKLLYVTPHFLMRMRASPAVSQQTPPNNILLECPNTTFIDY